MSTAEQSTNDDRFGYGEVFRQPEGNQPSKTAKNPHSKEKQKKLTWDFWESIEKDPNQTGGPYIKIYKRSDGSAASLARNSKPPYVQIDIAVARELLHTHDYERANQLMDAEKERANAAKQYAIKTATRGSIGRVLHCLSGAKVTKTEVLEPGLSVSFVTIPVKKNGEKIHEKFIVAGSTAETAVAIPVGEHAEKWGRPKIAEKVFGVLLASATGVIESQNRRKQKRHKGQKRTRKHAGKQG